MDEIVYCLLSVKLVLESNFSQFIHPLITGCISGSLLYEMTSF